MKKLLTRYNLDADLSALLLRLIFGGLFIYHGYEKIVHYHEWLAMTKPIIGLSAKLAYDLVTITEFGCGILIVLGFLTRLSVLPIMFDMTIAYFVAHKNDSFQIKELAFAYWLFSFVVFMVGSGRYSLDAVFFNKRKIRDMR